MSGKRTRALRKLFRATYGRIPRKAEYLTEERNVSGRKDRVVLRTFITGRAGDEFRRWKKDRKHAL